MRYIAQGMKRDTALSIATLTKHQYYYKPRPGIAIKKGRPVSNYTQRKSEIVENREIVEQINKVKQIPDTDYGYQRMTYT